MGPSVEGNGSGGHICADIGTFIPVLRTRHTDLWIGDRGDDPPNWEVHGGGPPPDGETSHGEIPLVPIRRDLELTFVGIGHVGSGS